MTAREYWSAVAPGVSPWACSGATNDGLPAIMVSREEMSSALPSPRSPSIARTPWAPEPSGRLRNSTLAGFTSRCRMPRSCSACRPAPTWRTTSAASGDLEAAGLQPVGEAALVGVASSPGRAGRRRARRRRRP